MRAAFHFVIFVMACPAWGQIDCADVVLSTRERLEAALDHVFERTDQIKADPVFVKLDRDLVQWMEMRLANLPRRARENFFAILNGAVVLDRYFPEGFEEDFWDKTYGYVLYSKNTVRLMMIRGLLESEVSRHILIHEATHLFDDRLDEKNLAAVAAKARAKKAGRLGVYRGEISAYREEYRHLNRVYEPPDLPRVCDLGDELSRLRKSMVEAGLAKLGSGRLELDFEKITSDEDWALVRAHTKAEGDGILLLSLVEALSLPEHRYVKKRVREYEEQQATLTQQRAWRTWRHRAIVGLLTGVGACAAVYWGIGF